MALACRSGDADAGASRLQDILRRRSCRSASCARSRARDATIYVLDGFTPDWRRRLYRDQCAAGHQLHDRACGMGRLRRSPWLAGRRRAASRHRHESARHFAGRGGGARPARADRKSRHRAAAEPPRLRRASRSSAQRQADPAVSRAAPAVSRRARFARQFLRHFSRRFGAFRSGAAGRSALRRQSDARPAQSDAERRRADRPHPAASQHRAGRDGRLWRHLDGQAHLAASPSWRSAMPTVCCAPASGIDDRPGGAAIVAGKRCPIVGRISMDLSASTSPICPRAPCTAAISPRSSATDITIDEVAAAAGTIGYEILTRLGPRSHLVYRGAERDDGGARATLCLPELRRGLFALGRQVRSLRRVEYAGRGRRRGRRGA